MGASLVSVFLAAGVSAQKATLPAPLGVPKPGAATDAPYAPQPILQGGVVVTLFPPGSPYLKMDRIKEPEQYSMSQPFQGESTASSTFTIRRSKSTRWIAA